jgi:flagellar assembly factor FliW
MPALDTSRFGRLEIEDSAVIEFPAGLIGLGGTRFALVPHGEGPFHWLQSLDDPDLALPVTDPWAFFPEYSVELSDEDSARVGSEDPAAVRVLVTVRATGDPTGFSANLRAPIVVHAQRGYQLINEAADAPVQAPLFGEAQD